MSRLLRIVLLLGFSAIGSSLALAGYYSMSVVSGYTGTVSIVGPTGGTWQKSYSWQNDGSYGGGALSSDFENGPVGKGTVTCDGDARIHFHWENGMNLADVPPKVVVVRKIGLANWHGISGNCQNGLGHVESPTYQGGSSLGTSYSMLQNPGYNFDVSVSPYSFASVDDPILVLNAAANVSVDISAIPVTMNLTGTRTPTQINQVRSILIGQGCQAQLVAPGLQFQNHQWDITGAHLRTFYELSKSKHWTDNPSGSIGLYQFYTPLVLARCSHVNGKRRCRG